MHPYRRRHTISLLIRHGITQPGGSNRNTVHHLRSPWIRRHSSRTREPDLPACHSHRGNLLDKLGRRQNLVRILIYRTSKYGPRSRLNAGSSRTSILFFISLFVKWFDDNCFTFDSLQGFFDPWEGYRCLGKHAKRPTLYQPLSGRFQRKGENETCCTLKCGSFATRRT